MPLLPQWERPFEPLLIIAVMPPRLLFKTCSIPCTRTFEIPSDPWPRLGLSSVGARLLRPRAQGGPLSLKGFGIEIVTHPHSFGP